MEVGSISLHLYSLNRLLRSFEFQFFETIFRNDCCIVGISVVRIVREIQVRTLLTMPFEPYYRISLLIRIPQLPTEEVANVTRTLQTQLMIQIISTCFCRRCSTNK